MAYHFVPLTDAHYREFQRWRYPGEYSLYDPARHNSGSEVVIRPDSPEPFAALDEAGAMVGFFEYSIQADAMVIGLALRPDLTGRGLGLAFVQAGIAFGRSHYAYTQGDIALDVAAFNRRAGKVYERAGFRETGRFIKHNPEGDLEFIRMRLEE